jgi:hypothetical protein
VLRWLDDLEERSRRWWPVFLAGVILGYYLPQLTAALHAWLIPVTFIGLALWMVWGFWPRSRNPLQD